MASKTLSEDFQTPRKLTDLEQYIHVALDTKNFVKLQNPKTLDCLEYHMILVALLDPESRRKLLIPRSERRAAASVAVFLTVVNILLNEQTRFRKSMNCKTFWNVTSSIRV